MSAILPQGGRYLDNVTEDLVSTFAQMEGLNPNYVRATVGSTVYVAGAGPVGLAAAASARILGAAVVLIGDLNKERLGHAKKVGFEPIDLTKHDRLGELVADVVGKPEVDCAIDCVGFEAKRQGSDGHVIEAPAVVLAIPIIAVTAFATSGD